VPEGRSWLHEAKYDGYRILARKEGDEVTLFSRSGLDWTVRFPAIAEAMQSFPAMSAMIDGEVAFVRPSGVTDFKSLQEHIDTPHPSIRYFVFDLLNLDGRDWRKKTLKERRARLAKLMATGVPDWLVYADYVEGSGPEFFTRACLAGLEGIISKRADSPYRSGRGKDWLKIKCLKGEEFVIGGYSRSEVKGKPFSSLLLGTFEDGKLIYSGKVGTGFDSGDFDSLAHKFKPLERAKSPFEEVPAVERKNAVWLEPELVAQIAFTERSMRNRQWLRQKLRPRRNPRTPSSLGSRCPIPTRSITRMQG
jgi:bifunctional non-homologous end joining protein LigD